MSIAERHKYILDRLRRDGYIKVSDIATELNITSVTARKDFRTLEEMGLLYRTHGSASPINPYAADRNVSQKELENRELKQRIGREAAKLIEANDSIMIATGSTIHAFVEEIRPSGSLNVVTTSLRVSLTLIENENIKIYQLGGIAHKTSLSIRETTYPEQLNQFTCSMLFIGADGINEEFGVTVSNLAESIMIRHMMSVCARTIVLVDSSKFSKRGFGRICDLDQIHTVITDPGITKAQLEKLEEHGINVIIAD